MGDDARPQAWTEALEGLVRSVRRTVELQQRMIQGATKPTEMSSAYVRFLRNELLPYGRTIADLTIDYYKALAAAAREYGTAFYDEMLVGAASDGGERSTGGRAKEPDRHALTLTGPVGSQAAASFTLENHDPDPAEVDIEPGVCRGPRGEAFAPSISIEPSALTIPPGGTATVTLRVELAPDRFDPEVGYRMPLHVHGPNPATIDVAIAAVSESAGPGGNGTKESDRLHIVECPRCMRTFERTTDSLRLRPHKTPQGDDCPEREGRRAGH